MGATWKPQARSDLMTIDHLSFASRDLAATRSFYEGKLGFPVLIHEWMT